MTNHIENILLNAYNDKTNGWIKKHITENTNNCKHYRSIRIGNHINCNGEVIKDLTTYDTVLNILNKYEVNIQSEQLKKIETKYEYSVELLLDEKQYEKLILCLQKKNKIA